MIMKHDDIQDISCWYWRWHSRYISSGRVLKHDDIQDISSSMKHDDIQDTSCWYWRWHSRYQDRDVSRYIEMYLEYHHAWWYSRYISILISWMSEMYLEYHHAWYILLILKMTFKITSSGTVHAWIYIYIDSIYLSI